MRRNKILGPLVAILEPYYESLLVLFSFGKYLSPNRTSVCLHAHFLVAVVFVVVAATGEDIGNVARLIPPRHDSGDHCACVCHFSYAYVTSVNIVMLTVYAYVTV